MERLLGRVLLVLLASHLLACKDNLDVKSDLNLPSVTDPNTDFPTIAYPLSSVFYSKDTELNISGLCKKQSTLILAGDEEQQTECVNQEYSFKVLRSQDGTYNLRVSQKIGKYETPAKNITWVRKTSVSLPALTVPNSNPYFSTDSHLNIQGGCETGSQIILGGDAQGQTTCENSSFSIGVSKFSDGNYNIEVKQRDQAGNEAGLAFVWSKEGLSTTPNDPEVRVTQSQVFTINGGAQPYTVTFLENNSNGTFDSATKTYTAGTVSGLVDKLEIEDAQGFKKTLNITVTPDDPDHFEFPVSNDGNNQSQLVGLDFTAPLRAKIADRFGNAIPNYDIVFKKASGDLFFKSNRKQRSDSEGLVSLSAQQGFTSARSYVLAGPATGVLPDVNGTGNTFLTFAASSYSNTRGNLGLEYDLGSGPENTIIQDFNNDGIADLVVLNKGSLNLYTFLGQASGVPQTELRTQALCSGVSAMASADFDSDGNLDLALSCSGIDKFNILLGRGDGTFQNPMSYDLDSTESLSIDIKTADLNSDGAQDLVILSAGNAKIGLRLGNNDGTFQTPSVYDAGTSPSKIFLREMDGLNGKDILVLNAGDKNVGIYLNNGSAVFPATPNASLTTGEGPVALSVEDFNNDGSTDIAVVNNIDNNIHTYLNSGNGLAYNGPDIQSLGPAPLDIYHADYNSDGYLDLFTVNAGDNTISVLENSTFGTFIPQFPLNTLTSPYSINAGDFNSDGNNDLVVVSNGERKVQIIANLGNKKMGLSTSTSQGPVKTLTADFDADGIKDAVVVSKDDNNVKIYKGNGKGYFGTEIASFTTGVLSPVNAIMEDFNGDFHKDIAVVNSGNDSLSIFLYDGAGAFQGPILSGVGQSGIWGLASGDMNNDGFVDLFVTSGNLGRLVFLEGDGTGSFTVRSLTNTGQQPTDLKIADLNRDGKLDVVLVNQSETTEHVWVYNGDGLGGLGSPAKYSAESGPNRIETGFFNGDAFLDVVVSNSTSSSVSLFLGNASGTLNTANNFSAGANPEDMVKGDFNNDGLDDLVVANGLDQKAHLLLASPAGSFPSPKEIKTNVNSVGLEVNDINADGALDLIVIDGTNNGFKILLGH